MHSIPNIPDTIAREIYAELCRSLPSLPDDTPEARHLREQHAMTAVAHLLPENVVEANVAVQIVAAQTHARDALQTASRIPGLDPGSFPGPDPRATIDPDARIRQCRAQAASMMRQADSAIRTLLRMQAERQKAEDALRPAAMHRAGYWFRQVSVESPGLIPGPDITESPGLTRGPAPEESESPGSTRGPTPGASPNSTPQSPEAPQPPAEPPKLEYGDMTPAERYVTLYPDRAATILAAGGLPARPTFQPPDPAVIAELLASNSPLIRAFRQARAREPIAA